MPTAEDASAALPGILARAADPAERAGQDPSGWLQAQPTASDALVEERLARWLRLVGDGTPAGAEPVLAARGLSLADVRAGFIEVSPATDPARWARRPAWARDAESMVGLLTSAAEAAEAAESAEAAGTPARHVPTLAEVVGDGLPEWAPRDQPWRFYPGFRAWLDDAAQSVAGWAVEYDAPLTAPARIDLALALARRLLGVIGPRLQDLAETSDLLFRGAEQAPSAWLRIWHDSPVMLRVMAVAWRQWRTTTEELIARMGADLPQLVPGRLIAAVESDAGDRHCDGRGVAAVTFDDGSRLFYKPRASGIEQPLRYLLDELDSTHPNLPPLGLRLPVMTDRGDYVWVREVAAANCPNPRAYFYRAGAMLRVVQALGATDLHHENFVPAADQPVLVDLETVIGPGRGWAGTTERPERLDLPGPTSMVNSWTDGPPGRRSLNLGALAGPEESLTPDAVPTLVQAPGGGPPTLRHRRLTTTNGAALPRMDGQPTGVGDYREDVVAGFADAQKRLVALADALAAGLRAAAPERAAIRFVARPTRVYTRLLQESLAAPALRDGVARELVLERLWRAVGTSPAAVIESEVTAMRDLDVPLFTIGLQETALVSDRGAEVPAAFAESPLAGATELLTELPGRSDEAVDDLRAELFCVCDHAPPPVGPAVAAQGALLECSDPVGVLLHEVRDTTGTRATANGTEGPRWVGLDYDPTRYVWRNRRLGPGLLGEAGIGLALFAAAPASPTGRTALLNSGRRVAGLRPGWSDADAFVGPAGVLYALAWAAQTCADDELLTAAEALVERVLVAARNARPVWGIDSVAGAVLALRRLAPDSAAARGALDEAAELLARAPAAASAAVDRPRGRWHEAMPSGAWGAALARKAVGLPPAEPAAAATVGDRLAAAALGGPAVPRSDVASTLLRDADVPISRNLSAIHGVAAVALLDLGDTAAAPKVRILQ